MSRKSLSRKLQKTNKDQYTVTIPKALIALLGLKEQDELEFGLEGNKLTLKKRRGGLE